MARPAQPRVTGAIDLDLESLLASGALEPGPRRPGLLARLWAWLTGPSPWEA